jgi:putative CocE/NonD family hydrolase
MSDSETDGPRIVTDLPYEVREIEHVWIPMSDGVRLSARLWLPEAAEDNPVPAILEYIPYRKRDGTRLRDDPAHRYWAGHGYAAIRLDIRGTGDSEGLIEDEYAQQEQDDAVEAIAWIAAQPWCSGAVGMTGISWGGFNSLQVAARRPPALKAIITHCSTDDRYADDVHFMGGCLLTDGFFWGSAFYHYMTRPPDPEIAGEGWREAWRTRLENWQPPASHIWMKHQRRDAYWRHGSVCEAYDDITCAVYAVGGWQDGYSNAVPRLLANLSCPAKGLIGPWGHKYPHDGIPGPAIGFLQEALRWWDHWLKGRDTGIMDEPAYRVWLEEPVTPDACLAHASGRWVTEPSWPSPNIVTRELFLNVGGLAEAAGAEHALTHVSPQTLGSTGGSWCPYGLGGTSPDLALDQREDDGRSLAFETAPLETRLEILGAPVARLKVQVDQPTGFLAVRLSDVAPDGTSQRVSFGLLNLTHRTSHEDVAPMTPGQWAEVSLQLNDIAHGFPIGHRLRLAVSTCYWPMVWPAPAPLRLTLAAGASTLTLPERAPRDEDARVPRFPPPEMAPAPEARTIEPTVGSRRLERDLATGETRMRLVEDSGVTHIAAIDLEVAEGMTCDYTIREGDPLSAEATWQWRSRRKRGDWEIEIETRTRLSASAEDFFIDTDVEAKEAGETVFTRAWRERVPRDGV